MRAMYDISDPLRATPSPTAVEQRIEKRCVKLESMSWFRGKKDPEPEPTPEPSFSADTSAFQGSTNFASGPPSRGPAGGGAGAAGMADLQVHRPAGRLHGMCVFMRVCLEL